MEKYIWLIPLLPLAGFVINGLGRNVLSKGVIGFIGSLLVLIIFLNSPCIHAGHAHAPTHAIK